MIRLHYAGILYLKDVRNTTSNHKIFSEMCLCVEAGLRSSVRNAVELAHVLHLRIFMYFFSEETML